jgi:hypothetical protein
MYIHAISIVGVLGTHNRQGLATRTAVLLKPGIILNASHLHWMLTFSSWFLMVVRGAAAVVLTAVLFAILTTKLFLWLSVMPFLAIFDMHKQVASHVCTSKASSWSHTIRGKLEPTPPTYRPT